MKRAEQEEYEPYSFGYLLPSRADELSQSTGLLEVKLIVRTLELPHAYQFTQIRLIRKRLLNEWELDPNGQRAAFSPDD